MRIHHFALTIVAALGLAACSNQPTSSTATDTTAVSATRTELLPILEAHTWTLVSATDSTNKKLDNLFPATGKPLTLGFVGGRLSITGGCNLRGGAFQINAEGLKDELAVGPMPSTLMACDPALMRADSTLANALAKPVQIHVDKSEPMKLSLVTDANETLVFTGRPTYESLYGPATQIFLEVASRTKACNHAMMGKKQCIQVRERHYNEKGLQVGKPGKWQLFYDSIEGFEHKEGVRNVLRVKRYTRANPPADASSHIYVLDMVVESEIVKRR